jgi:PAS domain S-box-containing protein
MDVRRWATRYAGPMALMHVPPSADEPQASRRVRYGYSFALLVLVGSLLLVAVAWDHARQREMKLAAEQFRGVAGQQASLVQLHLNSVEMTLRGGASLFAALDRPTPEQWRGYVDALRLQATFPSLIGVGYAASLDEHQLVRLQESWRADGRGLFELRPHGRRDFYAPILYMEPHTDLNRNAIGFDLYSEAARRQAMRLAMNSGQSQVTGRITLGRDAAHPSPALLLFAPVYGHAIGADSSATRRSNIRGWVFAPFRMDQMLHSALLPTRGKLQLRVVDVTDAAHDVLYQDAGIDSPHTFTHSLSMSFYGRRWRFDFFSGPIETAAPQLAAIDKLLLAGIAGSLLLFALAWMLASTEARARRLATDMTQNYRRSEQRFRNAMQYSAIGKALLDSNGAITENNPAFGRIFGRSDVALAGHSLNEFLDDGDSQPLVTSQMQAFDEAGGVIRLTRSLRRAGGDVRHVHLTFAPVPSEPGVDVSRLVQVEDVTERVRAEAAVQALNRTLEARVAARTRELSEANRELESFAYSVSHDLRAPLRAIEGFSRMLGERHADGLDATGRDYLDRVRKGTARMGELIDALLKLARIGRAEPSVANVDLSALAEEVSAGLADAEPGRAVEIHIQPGMRAEGDRMLLQVLLENLLGNAWKFTRGRGDARVELIREAGADGRDWFVVRDNGAGFDPDYANKLFKPFQRLHSQDEFPGHGIGLASVKRIIERHGGEIEADGRPGQGASFRFTLGISTGGRTDGGTR